MKKAHVRIITIVALALFIIGLAAAPCVAAEKRVNINTASVEELCTLKRIGPSYAQRIVDYRNANGPFAKPEDIMKVKGIGMRTYEANREIITCQ